MDTNKQKFSPGATLSFDDVLKMTGTSPEAVVSSGVNGVPEEKKPLLENVKSAFKERVRKASQSQTEAIEGKQRLGSATLQTIGEGAGLVGDIGFEAVKAITPEPIKKVVGKGLEKVASTEVAQDVLSKYQEWATQNPEAAKNLEATVNIASLLPVEKAISTVGKGVSEVVPKAVEKVVEKTAKLTIPKVATDIAKGTVDVIEDVRPKAADMRDRSLAKALRLAPVEDISVIQQSTGNDIGEFMNRFELVKDTPEETMSSLSKFSKDNMERVRDAIALVPEKYSFDDIPEIKDTLDFLKADLSGRKSKEYQTALKRLNSIETKGEFDLMDAQYIKNVFDDIESIYKRTGEVRDAVAAQDKAQVIAPVRRFIEDRVAEKYPQIDIRALNNNVQTSRAILDAVIKRAPKAETSSLFQLGDLAVLGVGNAQTPGLGYSALFAKKLFESAPLQLRISRFFANKASPKEVIKGLTPEKLVEMDKLITQELKDAISEEEITNLSQLKTEIQKASQSTTKTKSKASNISTSVTRNKSKSNKK